MKFILSFAICCLFISGCKKDDSPDPYVGTFQIKFMAGSNILYLNNGSGNLSISFAVVEWKIEKVENNHYTLTPVNDQSRILSADGSGAVYLNTHPSTLTDDELFTFETDPENNNLVSIQSVRSDKYLVYLYGLKMDGDICCWAIGFDDKVDCTYDWSSLGAASSGCQYSFELIKQ